MRLLVSVGGAVALLGGGVAGGLAQSATVLPTIVVTTPEQPKRAAAPVQSKSQSRSAVPGEASAKQQPVAAAEVPASTSTPDQQRAGAWPPSADALRGSLDLVGKASSASSGIVGQERLEARSPFRPAEILEAVPGLVITQHSGEGKANQYYLRGFNLDHGTDIAIFIDGMPVNMPSHGHGQGYADFNFIIPELARGLSFHKGPYFADAGNFASAGSIHGDYVDKLDKNIGQIEIGSFGHRRALGAMSAQAGTGHALVAAALQTYDGPWVRSDDLRKATGVARYSQGTRDDGWAVTAMGYSARWFATDQIPQRAVDQGIVGRYGTLDDTDGGNAGRYSLSARWARRDGDQTTRISAYAIRSSLDLFSNFTYFLDDPVNGDQFHQMDRRTILGAKVAQVFNGTLLWGLPSQTEIGVQVRHDNIHNGLFKTIDRQRLSTVREDRISETTIGVYGQNTLRWTPWFRTIAGLRADWHQGRVDSNLAANSGEVSDVTTSPKLGVVFGPWSKTEIYLSGGFGHHSNDLRGATSSVDPADGTTPLARSPLLVRSKGSEIGIRSHAIPGLQITASMFQLDYDSEIVFIGDAGTTEASRPSRRLGWEVTALYKILPWLTLDMEYASTHARFTRDDPDAPGRRIPGAVEGVAKLGLKIDNLGGWFGGVNWRYFGPRPLVEDNSVRSRHTAPLSAQLGYRFSDTLVARVDGFNLLNQRASQIDYFYASRLASEAGEVNDKHFHPLEPTSFRFTVTKLF